MLMLFLSIGFHLRLLRKALLPNLNDVVHFTMKDTLFPKTMMIVNRAFLELGYLDSRTELDNFSP